ncbi:transmembrane protein, putative [Medicago truncatula]|uniref:Transmembrane protein, putative n=1 Tax=Medicago truncatula TaxID=3880 RepID=G7ILD8_MEDTR|nr:transmembrane protein, putative [Medicago truncatula]
MKGVACVIEKCDEKCCESASKLKKLEFWKQEIRGRFSGLGGDFALWFFVRWFGKNRWPIYGVRWSIYGVLWPILIAGNKTETYFRA